MSDLTPTTQDYLKVIWNTQEWSDTPITTSALAEQLSVAPSTVSEAVKKLTQQGLVSHAPYGSIELTDEGRLEAVRMVRKHRLLETFLANLLDYDWDEVHDEAEVLEHAVSDKFINRLDALLGRPYRDPHGDPIPDSAGELPNLPAIKLTEAMSGERLTLARVSDREPEILEYLSKVGIGLDTEHWIVERREAAGMLTVQVGDRQVDLGLPVADAMWVIMPDEHA